MCGDGYGDGGFVCFFGFVWFSLFWFGLFCFGLVCFVSFCFGLFCLVWWFSFVDVVVVVGGGGGGFVFNLESLATTDMFHPRGVCAQRLPPPYAA